MAKVLIDGSWFFGGNRDRGIGRYLDYYFQHQCKTKAEDRVWLVPAQATDSLKNQLIANYGGITWQRDSNESIPRQQELWRRFVLEKKVEEIFYPSPFERPWSLLDWHSLIKQLELKTTAIVFDLLPLDYPGKILHHWSISDQKIYRQRVRRLSGIDELLAISDYTKQRLHHYLRLPAKEIKVLQFGLTPQWIKPPQAVDLDWWREVKTGQYVTTIAGGEWRKNIAGMLRYFARHYAPKNKHWQFLVICKLSFREELRFWWLSKKLGIASQVKFLGYLDERAKWRYLAQSEVFLFLSLAEGLGVPLLEAQQAKIPKIIISEELARAGFDQIITSKTKLEVAKAQDYN